MADPIQGNAYIDLAGEDVLELDDFDNFTPNGPITYRLGRHGKGTIIEDRRVAVCNAAWQIIKFINNKIEFSDFFNIPSHYIIYTNPDGQATHIILDELDPAIPIKHTLLLEIVEGKLPIYHPVWVPPLIDLDDGSAVFVALVR